MTTWNIVRFKKSTAILFTKFLQLLFPIYTVIMILLRSLILLLLLLLLFLDCQCHLSFLDIMNKFEFSFGYLL